MSATLLQPESGTEVLDSVAQFVNARHQMVIGGEWIAAASGRTLDEFDLVTGEEIAMVPAGVAADVNAAISAVRRAFDTAPWRTTRPSDSVSRRVTCRNLHKLGKDQR